MLRRIRITRPVRISFSPFVLALAGLVAFTPMGFAQDTKTDSEVPEGLGPRAGAAPQGQQQAPKSEVVSTHGKWSVQCTELPAEQGGKSCGMIQNAKNDKDERIAISVVVSRIKRDGNAVTFMRILAPIGVYLPTGIPIEIDGAALKTRMQFSRCLPRMCEGSGEASPETLARFKKGTDATFFLYDRPGNGYPMKVSLEGFGAALAALDKL
jgi:invasion protein IalB